MRRALALARLGWGQTAPNPMVGAVVVADGAIVGEGFHARFGESHAEPIALRASGDRSRGATLYVTLEPCVHRGKTPPCVEAIIAAGIARVVIAANDPSRIARGGAERLRAEGIRVDLGIERDAALEVNAAFFNAHSRDRPWVTLKLAIAADGGIADPAATRRRITGSEAQTETHRQRANSDAIAVGIGTVLVDDPLLNVRGVPPPRVSPRRIVFDSNLRTPLESRLVRTARDIHTSIVGGPAATRSSRAPALVAAGVHVFSAASLADALVQLRRDGVRSLYVEGGARLTGSLLAESLVDRLVIFQSPVVLGPGALQAFAFVPTPVQASLIEHRVVERRAFGDDLMTIYALENVPCSPG